MDLMAEIQTAHFWTGFFAIVWIDIILSGDNAVVIALAARSLPPHQQRQAVFWGAGAAVVLRVILTIFAVTLLKYPYLKLIGGLLLLWIAIKLLLPEEEEQEISGASNLFQAVKTILIADFVMSLDNVLAVAAAAKESLFLLIFGLLFSIPLMIFSASLLMKVMTRYPIIITLGAAMIGWVAGNMLVTDHAVAGWIEQHLPWIFFQLPFGLGTWNWSEIATALLVIAIGKMLAKRATHRQPGSVDLAADDQANH